MIRRIHSDPDVAATAALIGDPSRAAILMALADGRALPAGELGSLRASLTADRECSSEPPIQGQSDHNRGARAAPLLSNSG